MHLCTLGASPPNSIIYIAKIWTLCSTMQLGFINSVHDELMCRFDIEIRYCLFFNSYWVVCTMSSSPMWKMFLEISCISMSFTCETINNIKFRIHVLSFELVCCQISNKIYSIISINLVFIDFFILFGFFSFPGVEFSNRKIVA